MTSYLAAARVAGKNVVTLALRAPVASSLTVNANSRQAATNKPQLVFTLNAAPSVSLTSPADSAAGAPITLTAAAADSDGTITKVQLFAGANLIGTVTQAPYTIDWTNVGVGSYALTAKATDNLGTATTSSPVNIIVTAAPALHFIHPDHLNTPRVITNQAQQVVWRWDNDDPFGANMANENPSGLGTFTCNLRFPGQYFDRETNNHYNYFRDYDPSTGRYVQSDPIGLEGKSLNTYGYVNDNPLKYIDSKGLEAELCARPFYPFPVPYADHCFIRFNENDNDTSSYDTSGTHSDLAPSWWPKSCQPTKGEQDDDCVKREMKKCKAEDYDFTGNNCCHCVERALKACGQSIPVRNWPNWPVNPGPQPGEKGGK